MTLANLRDDLLGVDLDESALLDDPDCLAELEFTYSVFRFRYTWGTVYEITFSNLADACDRSACWALLPPEHVIIDTQETDTLGAGFNGVDTEVTHRVLGRWARLNRK